MSDARDVISAEITRYGRWCVEERTDAVLAALAAAGLSITATPDTWEWGVLPSNGIMSEDPEDYYRTYEDAKWVADHWDGAVVVRRRPAGPWEVAPDAV